MKKTSIILMWTCILFLTLVGCNTDKANTALSTKVAEVQRDIEKTKEQETDNIDAVYKYEFTVYEDQDIFDIEPEDYSEHLKKKGWPTNYIDKDGTDFYTSYVFPDRKYKVEVPRNLKDEKEIVEFISVDFTKHLVGETKFREMKESNLGYMCWLDWGFEEELEGGHVLIANISLKDKAIWWMRCN